MPTSRLRVVVLKPSKYGEDGFVERFSRGFMPNATLAHILSMTPAHAAAARCEVHAVDEYVHTDLEYLSLLRAEPGVTTLLALVGVQSHQLHRALDLAAYARARGVACSVVGGPHPMTCETGMLQGRGVSFSVSEAEVVWTRILEDAARGELAPVYGAGRRWQERLDPPVLQPPSKRERRRYVVPMLGVSPARGCPYACNFCSVIKIAGRQVRSEPLETTMATLRAAKAAGVSLVMFTSDNFNKVPQVRELLLAMVAERIRIPFFVQCDALVHREPDLVELLARAGCFQMFVGVESFRSDALRDAHKFHNHPDRYGEIVRLCRRHAITTHFSNILGFPSDTEETVLDHLRALRTLAPDVASFYILTPIPGTEQYDDFLRLGTITEDNLDRFDATSVTWRHPLLDEGRLRELLFRCYREFYAPAGVAAGLARVARGRWDFRTPHALYALSGGPLQARLAVRRRAHPMAGGIGRVRLDHVSDYLPLRRRAFGLERAPLPRSLALSAADEDTKFHPPLR
ncbi:MAG TPA: B12-binding domain-containing radical SAM protein [Vicinamibacteria bacterium]|nr:B12-binding domain-containing radical SAM protein [Vicinamibacteria bacterium]